MGDAISGLFGGKPKKPTLVTQPVPVEKVQQGNIEKDKIYRDMAKRRRATILNQQAQMKQVNVGTQKMGAGL